MLIGCVQSWTPDAWTVKQFYPLVVYIFLDRLETSEEEEEEEEEKKKGRRRRKKGE